MIKADLHMHTCFSPDSDTKPEQLVKKCQQVGLNCVAITDHNTIDGALAVRDLAPFQVIIGEEIRSTGGEITGLFLTKTIPQGLSPLETVDMIKTQGGLVSLPHPFDHFRSHVISQQAMEEIIPYIDIVESFNSRNSLNSSDKRAEAFARSHNLLVSGVSDAHTIVEIGRTYLAMPGFDGTPEDFKTALSQANIVGKRITPLIHILTSLTKLKKRFLRKHV